MKKRTGIIIAAPLAAGLIALATAVSAMPPGGRDCGNGGFGMGHDQRMMGKGPSLERLAERLDLTQAQRAQVEVIIETSQPQMLALRDEMRANRDDIKALVQQDGYDERAVRRVANDQGDRLAELIMLRTRQRYEIADILTEAQLAQLDAMRERRQGRGWGR